MLALEKFAFKFFSEVFTMNLNNLTLMLTDMLRRLLAILDSITSIFESSDDTTFTDRKEMLFGELEFKTINKNMTVLSGVIF